MHTEDWGTLQARQLLAMGALVLGLGACASGLSPGGTWRDSAGTRMETNVLWSWRGQVEHCDWGSATFLWIGRGASVAGISEEHYDQYVRDPEGLFTPLLDEDFLIDVGLPPDAEFTGYSTSKLRLWIAPSVRSAVFLEVGERYEQWPRVAGPDPILCA